MDSNFTSLIQILNNKNIPYWLCHGTLLGVIRDKKLIEWDHDIDIALWEGQISKTSIIKIMEENDFVLRRGFGVKDDVISFDKKGGRIVDINFYEIIKSNQEKDDIAYVKWFVPKNNFMKLIDALSESKNYSGKFKKLIKMTSIFQELFIGVKSVLIKLKLFYKEIGYSEPASLCKNIKKIEFNGLKVNVPTESEKYLKYLYGEEWKIPKKNYIWYKDSNALSSSKK